MKKLLYLSLVALVALTVSCKKEKEPGAVKNPCTTKEAVEAVSDLTWTSNTEYETTGVLYVKGTISRVADLGYYKNGGTYGNASFYIASDETPEWELFCFRILYLENKKYISGPDIKVGDKVVICGKLMNYKGTFAQTVPNEAYLFSLN